MNDSKLDQLVRLISEWPGLMSRPHRALIDDGLVLLVNLGSRWMLRRQLRLAGQL